MTASGGVNYLGPIDVVRKTLRTEGPLAFYKGLSATFLRLWPHTVLLWLAQEAISKQLRSGFWDLPDKRQWFWKSYTPAVQGDGKGSIYIYISILGFLSLPFLNHICGIVPSTMILAHSNSPWRYYFNKPFDFLEVFKKSMSFWRFMSAVVCIDLLFPVTLSRSKESGEQLPSVADVNIRHFIIIRWLFQDHQGLRWRYAEDLLMKLLEFGHVQPPPKLRVDPPSWR